mgnify:CR=1 FL=1
MIVDLVAGERSTRHKDASTQIPSLLNLVVTINLIRDVYKQCDIYHIETTTAAKRTLSHSRRRALLLQIFDKRRKRSEIRKSVSNENILIPNNFMSQSVSQRMTFVLSKYTMGKLVWQESRLFSDGQVIVELLFSCIP